MTTADTNCPDKMKEINRKQKEISQVYGFLKTTIYINRNIQQRIGSKRII